MLVTLRVLSAADVATALPMSAAIEAMRDAFGQLYRGSAELPLRTVVPLEEGDAVLLVMPARCRLPLGVGGKFVSVVPSNSARGLPLVNAAVLLVDPGTGRPAALLEGNALTAIRTGAASGLATDLLARPDAAHVAVIGSGVQARTQLEAVGAVRPITGASVYSRTREHAERFAREMGERLRLADGVGVASSVREAVRDADVVCTATSSSVPVLVPGDVEPGVHINAVGSYTREMREVDPALLARALVVVDQIEAAMAEAGEVVAAVEGGLIARAELVELGALVAGAVPGRRDERDVTLFKSVGVAVQDLAAGARAVAEAERRGIGTEVEL